MKREDCSNAGKTSKFIEVLGKADFNCTDTLLTRKSERKYMPDGSERKSLPKHSN